jgi:nicotinamide mononucleotide transporter
MWNWIKKSFQGLNVFEKFWLYTFSAIILAATVYFSATGTDWKNMGSILMNWVVSPVSALTGVICVVLCAKGNIANYIWGAVNALTYGAVAFTGGYYGDFMLNILFFLPSQYFIYKYWKDSLKDGVMVKMEKMGWGGLFGVVIICILATLGFAQILAGFDNWFTQAFKKTSQLYAGLTSATGWTLLGPTMDASTVVLQIVAQILLIKKLAEQWYIWIAVDVITVGIWSLIIIMDHTSWSYAIPTLVMWVAFLVNAVYGLAVWLKGTKKPITA